ncbi:MAG: hypothetical protein ACN6OP_05110 [Pseudomonadales bacterium]
MFSEASLSNSRQALSNSLILDERAVPTISEQVTRLAQQTYDLINSLKEKINRARAELNFASDCVDVDEDFVETYLLYQRALERSLGCFSEDESSAAAKCGYFRLLSYLNLFRVIKNLVKRKKNSSTMILVIRTGFFFAFKENMKNTP